MNQRKKGDKNPLKWTKTFDNYLWYLALTLMAVGWFPQNFFQTTNSPWKSGLEVSNIMIFPNSVFWGAGSISLPLKLYPDAPPYQPKKQSSKRNILYQ